MNVRIHPLVIGSAGIAALLGVWLPWPAALALALLLGWAAAAGVAALQARRLRRLAQLVNSWLGDRAAGAVPVQSGHGWQELGVALNAVGAAYARRGDELRRERPWRRQLVDSIVGPALLFSAESRLLAANEDARHLLGIPSGGHRTTVVQALGSAALAGAVREARAAGRPVEVEAEVGARELRAVASVVGDETLVIVTDRTRERRLTDLRRDFVANASHELKTPATSIRTLSEAIGAVMATDPGRARQLVGRLETESGRLVALVHNLLDLRRLEDHDPDDPAPVDLADIVRETVTKHGAQARERELQVHVALPEHAMVVGIPRDMRLIVDNLVANAIQYNRPGGEVRVELTIRPGGCRLAVHDTGIGIPQQDRARIFERFYRVDPDRSRAAGGTGLGLSLVRHAVARQGGRVHVESLLGEGSTFTVELPVEPA